MMRPQEEYEFPTGYRKSFGVERFKIPEPIFNPALIDGKSSICGAAYLVRYFGLFYPSCFQKHFSVIQSTCAMPIFVLSLCRMSFLLVVIHF